MSNITSRSNHYQGHAINQSLAFHLSKSKVKRVKHNNLKSHHLHDDRHLKRSKNQGESMSGVQLLIKKMYETMTEKIISHRIFSYRLSYRIIS